MRRLLTSITLGLVCGLLNVVSVQGADREHQQMMADIRMLQEQNSRLHLMLGALDETLQALMGRLDTRFDSQSDESRRALADQKLLMDSVSGGVRVVREKVDETNVRVSSLTQEVEALRLAIPKTPTPLTRLLVDPETGLPTGAAALSSPGAEAPPVAPGVSPQRMYNTAWSDYTTGQWELSIQGFEAYLSAFPGSEQADDAQFYIGENLYADGQFRAAADAYEQVVLAYADGDVVAEALYKRGLALSRLDEPELARQAFELVVKNHPDNNMANLAQQQLDRARPPQ
jgi:tol-pal system protein YbgF